ncbi:MAG: peptidase U34 [Anaerolinea sp.]|nr:peptidase U34 [Anaerolinea sp.]
MCDTIVALGNSTTDGKIFFAKNSDREPNEAHDLVIIPHCQHQAGERVKCTYIEIPQVDETFQVLLAKPFWIWGAEMGANEFGVTIGNEAVFTRDAYGKEPGLIGMDFLRLALERSKTAHEALMTIIELLEKYGQSGNCGFAHKMYYQNSFLICDPDEAWVLETSAKEWAAEKVKDVRTISNAITIDGEWDMASANLVQHALDKGWCKDRKEFSFSKCYSEPVYTLFSDAHKRQNCTTQQLKAQMGKITPAMMMEILRHHDDKADPNWSPDKGITGADVCMHSGWGPIRGSQSAGSMVSSLDRSDTVHWVTGTSAPCTSLFKPVWLDCGLPDHGEAPTGTYNENTLYWSHEAIHRAILKDYAHRLPLIQPDQVRFEEQMLADVNQNLDVAVNKRKSISERYFKLSQEIESSWLQKVNSQESKHQNRLLYRSAWKKFNDEAKMNQP